VSLALARTPLPGGHLRRVAIPRLLRATWPAHKQMAMRMAELSLTLRTGLPPHASRPHQQLAEGPSGAVGWDSRAAWTPGMRLGRPIRAWALHCTAICQHCSRYQTLAALTRLGSQTGSQRRQTSGHTRRQPAMVCAARSPIRPHPATSSHTAHAPEKRKAGGSIPPLTTSFAM